MKRLLVFPQIKLKEGRFVSCSHKAPPGWNLVGKPGRHVGGPGRSMCVWSPRSWAGCGAGRGGSHAASVAEHRHSIAEPGVLCRTGRTQLPWRRGAGSRGLATCAPGPLPSGREQSRRFKTAAAGASGSSLQSAFARSLLCHLAPSGQINTEGSRRPSVVASPPSSSRI